MSLKNSMAQLIASRPQPLRKEQFSNNQSQLVQIRLVTHSRQQLHRLLVPAFFGPIFKRIVHGSLLCRPVLGRPTHTEILDHFRHDVVDAANVADFEDAVILDVDVIRDESLVDIAAFVDVVETDCDLQKTVHESFGV